MAEINIQPKKKPLWPWVVLALVILVGAMVLFWMYYEEDPTNSRPVPRSTGHRQAVQYLGTDFFRSGIPAGRCDA